MKRITHAIFTLQLVAMLLSSLLAGCDTLNNWLAPDRVDYKSAKTAPSLEVPADLSQPRMSNRFAAPVNTAGLGGEPARIPTKAGSATIGVPTPVDPLGMHIERDGDHQWLVVNGRTPEQLWPLLKAFWQENGFTLAADQPEIGILSTDWAENRAKIPNDWFRSTVGKFIDKLYSSGTRDQFTTLVERGAAGTTTLSILHRGMEEVLTGRDKSSSRWTDAPRDPALEQTFLTLLMQRFGLTGPQAQQLMAQARPVLPRSVVVEAGHGALMLTLHESFELAWPRVGLALDRSHFTVNKFDKAKGLYYVRFSDPQHAVGRTGWLSKLFANKREPAKEYLVRIQPKDAATTQMTVVDMNGQLDSSSDAQRIITVLQKQLQ